MIERARWTGARAHVLHVSSSDALPMLATARRDGVRITAETCPHYLTLFAEEIADGATTHKCCPPIREASNRELLWQGLLDGTIDCIVSDHSPSTPELKLLDTGDFGQAWGGVSSLQLGLPLVWTEARRRGIGLERVVEWMAGRPADLVGLSGKGRVALGHDADMVVFAPDDAFVVDPARLHHKNPVTPYAGRSLSGVVRRTLLAGARRRRLGSGRAAAAPGRDHDPGTRPPRVRLPPCGKPIPRRAPVPWRVLRPDPAPCSPSSGPSTCSRRWPTPAAR